MLILLIVRTPPLLSVGYVAAAFRQANIRITAGFEAWSIQTA